MILSSFSAISDTTNAEITAAAAEKQETGWILEHVLDNKSLFGYIHLPEFHLFGIDFSLTNQTVFLWIASAILLIALTSARYSYKKSLVPKGLANLIEVFIIFVRDEIAKPTIGKGYEKFLPFLLTAFFFILTCNFLGLIPFGTTATSNLGVTAGLALVSFFVIQIGGMVKNGVFGYFKGLVPHGIPAWLLPIMIPVELLGLFTKPFALAVRLFANMTAGHIVIMALLGLIFILHTYAVVPVSIAFALFIYFLEILVAFIQSYIFTMLSSLFIGMAVHQDH